MFVLPQSSRRGDDIVVSDADINVGVLVLLFSLSLQKWQRKTYKIKCYAIANTPTAIFPTHCYAVAVGHTMIFFSPRFSPAVQIFISFGVKPNHAPLPNAESERKKDNDWSR